MYFTFFFSPWCWKRWFFSSKTTATEKLMKGAVFWNYQGADPASSSFAVTFAWEPSAGLDPCCWLRLITASTSGWESAMKELAPDVVLAQEDTSLAIGLCASLPSGAGHQNLGNPILGWHLAHLPNSTETSGSFLCWSGETAKSYCLRGVILRQLRRMRGSGNQLRKEPG